MSILFNSALAAGAAYAVKMVKDKKISPVTEVKKALNFTKLTYPVNEVYNNGAALTPPMGWSSWNTFRNSINEDLIFDTAVAVKNSGLADCGYIYINMDDCWMSSERDGNGRLQGDLVAFPSGIKSLAEKVNGLGLKLGIYSSNGTLTCEDLPASLYHESVDADTFAEWGIEYFKYDFGHNIPIPVKAPKIEKISISFSDNNEIEYSIDESVLSGQARIVDEASLPGGKYVDGLDSNCGSILFDNILSDDDIESVLNVYVFKSGNSDKHLEVIVDECDRYSLNIPPTKAPSPEGKHQLKIKLRKGVNTIKLYNPVASRQDSAAIQFTNMGKELKRATREYAEKNCVDEKPIVYSICEWGANLPWRWGRQAGNLWRTTPDIKPNWLSILGIYEFNVNLANYAVQGGWNDPDMLEVGNGNLTFEENKSHFSLWCMMSAPLILGNDIRKLIKNDGTPDYENPIYRIITNREMIAVDQDALGVQCRRVKSTGLTDYLVKPLADNTFAVCLFNKSSSATTMSFSITDVIERDYVSSPISNSYAVTDLWSGLKSTVANGINTTVPGHGVRVFRVEAV